MAFPEPPETFLQWKAALMQVSILYMRGQWKHCAAQCSQLLLEAKTSVWSSTLPNRSEMSLSKKSASSIARDLSPLLLRRLK